MPDVLSLCPDLFAYKEVGPFLIRFVLALIFIGNGYSKLFKTRLETINFFNSIKIKPGTFWVFVIGSTEIISGTMLLIGFLTQLAAAVVSLIIFIAIIKVKIKQGFLGGYDFDLLILAAALSLLVLGPGIFSIDLPL